MRIGYIILVSVLMFACNSTKPYSNDSVEILKAYKQIWYGGQPGVKGVNYMIELASKTDKVIKFDSVKINAKWHEVSVKGDNPIKLTVNITNNNKPNTTYIEKSPSDQPIDIKVKIIKPKDQKEYISENVLAYSIEDKVYYLPIKSFQTMEAISYP